MLSNTSPLSSLADILSSPLYAKVCELLRACEPQPALVQPMDERAGSPTGSYDATAIVGWQPEEGFESGTSVQVRHTPSMGPHPQATGPHP